jgi:hypothetical protein
VTTYPGDKNFKPKESCLEISSPGPVPADEKILWARNLGSKMFCIPFWIGCVFFEMIFVCHRLNCLWPTVFIYFPIATVYFFIPSCMGYAAGYQIGRYAISRSLFNYSLFAIVLSFVWGGFAGLVSVLATGALEAIDFQYGSIYYPLHKIFGDLWDWSRLLVVIPVMYCILCSVVVRVIVSKKYRFK